MSKKVWIGGAIILGFMALGALSPNKQSTAHATALKSVTYSGPALVRTNWYSQNDRDPMTGQSTYSTLLTSSNDGDTKAALYFKCDSEASVTLVVENEQVADHDHFFFDTKVGDSEIFQVFGQKLGTNRIGTAFQLDEDALESGVKDGVPIYFRYTIDNQVSTIAFVPNDSDQAMAPVKQCKHG